MPRPPGLEYKGAIHHVMNRGRDHQSIYLEDEDYEIFLGTLAEVTKEYHGVIHAYCLMTNRYHLLVETPKANLGGHRYSRADHNEIAQYFGLSHR
jgi:REP element-mobilizing transposase RayT